MRLHRLSAAVLVGLLASSSLAHAAVRIGPTFGAELVAAGCADGVSWQDDGTLNLMPGVDPGCPNKVLAAHDPTRKPVPATVTRLQGRLELSRAGLLSQAESAIASAGGDLPIWYADAATWARNDPHVLSLAAALNLSPAQLDSLFIAAAAIQ